MDTPLSVADGSATVEPDRHHSIVLVSLPSLPVAITQARGRLVRASDTTNTIPLSQAAD
jgi:hypothetical protein